MKGVLAIDDAGALGRPARELDRRLDQLGAGIGEEDLVEIGRLGEEPFREHAGKNGDVHLHQVRQSAVEHADQRVADRGVVAAERENPEAAQKIEIFGALAIVEVLPAAAYEPDVVADGPQDPDHLLVQKALVQREALSLALGIKSWDVQRHVPLPWRESDQLGGESLGQRGRTQPV